MKLMDKYLLKVLCGSICCLALCFTIAYAVNGTVGLLCLWVVLSILVIILLIYVISDNISNIINSDGKSSTLPWYITWLHGKLTYNENLETFDPLHVYGKYDAVLTGDEDDPVTNELLLLAQSLHAKLTFPWYSHISPDGQSHQQLCGLMEEVLLSCWYHLRESGGLQNIALDCINAITQLIQLHPPSGKQNDQENNHGIELTKQETNEMMNLTQLLLLSHLPNNIIPCEAIVFLLRDILATNVIIPFYYKLSNPASLSENIIFLLAQDDEQNVLSHKNEVKQSGSVTTEVCLNKLALISESNAPNDKKEIPTKQLNMACIPKIEQDDNSVCQKSKVKKSVPVAISQSILPSSVLVIKPVAIKQISPKKYLQNSQSKSKKWNKSLFSKGIVDGVKEEEYKNTIVGFAALPQKTANFVSKSRPNSPQTVNMNLFPGNIATENELHRSKSWSNITPSPELADEATNSFILRACESPSSPISSTCSSALVNSKRSASWAPAGQGGYENTKRRRKRPHLIKMNSFDNNDATVDSFPNISDIKSYPLIKAKSASEELVQYDDDDYIDTNFTARYSHKEVSKKLDSVFYIPNPKFNDTASSDFSLYKMDMSPDCGNIAKKVCKEEGNSIFYTGARDVNISSDSNTVNNKRLKMVDSGGKKKFNCKNDEINKKESYDLNDETEKIKEPFSNPVPSGGVIQSSLNQDKIDDGTHGSKIDQNNDCTTLADSVDGSSLQQQSEDTSTEELSPIYEESNTLESSIAKLRSLLSERDSQQSLTSLSSVGSSDSEREPKSANSDPGRSALHDSIKFSFFSSAASAKNIPAAFMSKKQSSKGLDIVEDSKGKIHSSSNENLDILEAADVPLDGRIFIKCCLTNTESKIDSVGNQYTAYTIQYDAIYLSEEFENDMEKETVNKKMKDEVINSEGPRMVLHTNIVTRRFREFIVLHNALSSHPLLRHSIKGMQGPNKWRYMPLNKLDNSTVGARKNFLEDYLQTLLQKLEINCSAIMRDFLAYSSEESITFARKPLALSSHRLSKLLGRTMSGVFRSLRPTLPIAEGEICNYNSEEPSTATKMPKNYQGFCKQTANGTQNFLLPSSQEGGKTPITPVSESPPPSPTEKPGLLNSENIQEYDLHLAITAEVQQPCAMEEAIFRVLQYSEVSQPRASIASHQTSIDSTDFDHSCSYNLLSREDLLKSRRSQDIALSKESSMEVDQEDNKLKDACTPEVHSHDVKDNQQSKSRFFLPSSHFVDDFLENAKRKVNANLGVPISSLEVRRKSLTDDSISPDGSDDKHKNIVSGCSKQYVKAADTAHFKAEADGTDSIFSKERIKGVYSKVRSSSLLSGSQIKPKEEKNAQRTSKDNKLELPFNKRNSSPSPTIVYSNVSTPSLTPVNILTAPNQLKQSELKSQKSYQYYSRPCRSCYGSAVPSIYLPNIKKTCIPSCCDRNKNYSLQYGTAIFDLIVAVIVSNAKLKDDYKLPLALTETVIDLINTIIVPPLNTTMELNINEYVNNVSIASYVRAVRLNILETNFFTYSFGNTDYTSTDHVTRRRHLSSNQNKSVDTSNNSSNKDCLKELKEILRNKIPSNILVQIFGVKIIDRVFDYLQNPDFCKLLALRIIKVIISHLLSQRR